MQLKVTYLSDKQLDRSWISSSAPHHGQLRRFFVHPTRMELRRNGRFFIKKTSLFVLEGLELFLLLVVIERCNQDDDNNRQQNGHTLHPLEVVKILEGQAENQRDNGCNDQDYQRRVLYGIPHKRPDAR
jgi:hypothetical protein